MKKLFLIPVAVLLLVGLILGGCTQPAPSTPAPAPTPTPAPEAKKPVELSIVMFIPDIPPGNAWTHMLADKVASKSKGELTIKIVGGPEAIPTPDLPAAAQRGSVDIANVMHTYADTLAPGIDCIGRAEYAPAELRVNGCLDYAQELCNKAGLYYLGASSPSEPQQQLALFVNKEIKTFNDLKGLKIAAPGGDHKAMIEAFGSTCLPINFMDFYTGMERGTIDGYTIGVPGIQDFGLEPVTKYMLDELFTSNGAAFLVNMEKWNSLSQAHKDILTEAAKETEIEGVQVYKDLCDKVRKEISAAGVKVITFASHDDSVKYYKSYRDAMAADDLSKNANVAKFQKFTLNPDFYRLK